MALLNRYVAPLLVLASLVYIVYEPSEETTRQLRVKDPQSVQFKMGNMQSQSTEYKYVSRYSDYKYAAQVHPYDTSDTSTRGVDKKEEQEQQQQQQQQQAGEQETQAQSSEEQSPAKKKVRSNLQTEQQKREKLLYSRNKNILTLGGSTTWGSKLEQREAAYPFLLPNLLGPTWRVHNLAVRATDASYASQCIESMIREGVTADSHYKKEVEFDVILLEYSLNGLDGMELLVQRLRQRYPNAVIVYIHLWSLRMSVDNAKTGAKPREELHKGLKFKDADKNINDMLGDPKAQWAWAPKMKADSEALAAQAEKMVTAIGGHVYKVPMPEASPQVAFTDHWFGPDYHHLSDHGHELVATELSVLLQDETIMGGPAIKDIHNVELSSQVGTWGAGDHCYSWYETGHHPDVQVDGGTMKMFVKPDKYAVNVGLTFGQPATFTFPNRKQEAQPVMLMIMSWGPGVYPKSQIDLVSPGFAGGNQTSVLDPLHPNPLNHVFHVTRTAHVGWAHQESKSSIIVEPLEDKQRPLRVIGIVMCGACLEMDDTYLNNDATHQRLGGTMPKPEEEQPPEEEESTSQQQQEQQQGEDADVWQDLSGGKHRRRQQEQQQQPQQRQQSTPPQATARRQQQNSQQQQRPQQQQSQQQQSQQQRPQQQQKQQQQQRRQQQRPQQQQKQQQQHQAQQQRQQHAVARRQQQQQNERRAKEVGHDNRRSSTPGNTASAAQHSFGTETDMASLPRRP